MSRSISSVRSAAWSAVSEKTKTTEGDHARHKCLAQIAGHSLSEAHEAYQLAVSYRSVFASAHTGADGGQHAAIGIASPCNRFASDNERVAGESGRLRARVKDCGRVGDPDERGYVGVLHIVDWTSTCVRVCDCHVTAGLCPMEGNVSPERIGLWRIIQSCTCFASRYAKGFSISARASAISSLSYRRMRQWGARTRRAVRRTDEHDIRSISISSRLGPGSYPVIHHSRTTVYSRQASRLTLILLDNIIHHQVEQLVVPFQRPRDCVVSRRAYFRRHPHPSHPTLRDCQAKLEHSPSLPPMNLTRTLLSTYCARLRMLSRFFFSPGPPGPPPPGPPPRPRDAPPRPPP
jgi:hypothetical protein